MGDNDDEILFRIILVPYKCCGAVQIFDVLKLFWCLQILRCAAPGYAYKYCGALQLNMPIDIPVLRSWTYAKGFTLSVLMLWPQIAVRRPTIITGEPG